MTTEAPRVDAADRYQDGSYAARNPSWHEEDSAWKAGEAVAMLRRHEILPRSVYDVGCGVGAVLDYVARRLDQPVECTGFDIAESAVETARNRARVGLDFRVGDFLALDVPRADVLLAFDLIEHLENPFAFLRALVPRADMKLFHVPLGHLRPVAPHAR